jgi:hypothetical protein
MTCRGEPSTAHKVIFALLLLALLGGCVTPYTPWPGEGGGGLGEQYSAGDEALALLKARYQMLLERRAEERAPSQMLLAQTLIIRAFRERAGGLAIDSGQTEAAASAVLDKIERQLGARRG